MRKRKIDFKSCERQLKLLKVYLDYADKHGLKVEDEVPELVIKKILEDFDRSAQTKEQLKTIDDFVLMLRKKYCKGKVPYNLLR